MQQVEIAKLIRAAIKQDDMDTVKELIGDSKELLNIMTPFGTWLHVAAKQGNLQIVKWLMSRGADINAKGGTFNGAPINLAASAGHKDVVLFFIQQNAELDVTEPERNPLYGAIYGGHVELVRIFLEAGIDPLIKYTTASMKQKDALVFARERGQLEIAAILEQWCKAKHRAPN